jgi:hypothetical protein
MGTMNGSVRGSAGLVWHHQRLVWWVFGVNLVIAWLSSLSVRATLSAVLDHSLESAKLFTGFDISTLMLLLERPDVPMRSLAVGAGWAVLAFLVYLLFIDGGVITVFLDDRKLNRAEFFENCGLFFWRMVRLALYSLVPFGLVAAAHSGINEFAEKLSSDAPQERLGFFVNAAGILVVMMVTLFVRMCFDLAQAQMVRDNERGVLRVLWLNIRIALRSGKLFAEYLGIGLFAAATFGAGIGIWVYLPHSAAIASFLVLELVTLTQIASRLWLKAASARWVSLLPIDVTFPPTPVNEAPAPVIEVTDARTPLTE